MVLQVERTYPAGYQNSAYQGPNGSYSSFQDVTQQTTPYSGYPNMSSYSSTQAQQYQSGMSTGVYGSGGSHYSSANAGFASGMKPSGGYGNSHYGSSYGHGSPHGQSHGAPHGLGYGSPHGQSHGAPHGQGYGSSHGYGNSHGYGSGLTHGHNNYGHGSSNYGHTSSGMNHGSYGQKPSWMLKGLDDDEE
ncbi:hypothetical protein CTI12_AA214020 [Artemisia annua]|uniref:Uncharacterized protein n=1 Tax=Artemisia annua TaxID=35608 RepID=A0A2U1NYK7_ARTAN|nr:hypothetical protein CTI12_AA214020 [Artemisia annua]